jgi:hypothetical protein
VDAYNESTACDGSRRDNSCNRRDRERERWSSDFTSFLYSTKITLKVRVLPMRCGSFPNNLQTVNRSSFHVDVDGEPTDFNLSGWDYSLQSRERFTEAFISCDG